ncbi:MAG: dephospho-CoA kinase [Rhodospirillaceae bacterium]|jgi:dephospho-CoA kinase|nr:dephospho-CoA kinase [Rhodospirillaceae bacterium]
MIILGLTGSIGMGKSTATRQLQLMRIPVYDADREVHLMLEKGGIAINAIEQVFPNVINDGAVNRDLLRSLVFNNHVALKLLESIIHPIIYNQISCFIKLSRCRRNRLVVLDIPLLFETCNIIRVDTVAVVSCPAFMQVQRVLSRTNMTLEKLIATCKHQLSDHKKRQKADFIIHTGAGLRLTLRKIHMMMTVLLQRKN